MTCLFVGLVSLIKINSLTSGKSVSHRKKTTIYAVLAKRSAEPARLLLTRSEHVVSGGLGAGVLAHDLALEHAHLGLGEQRGRPELHAREAVRDEEALEA